MRRILIGAVAAGLMALLPHPTPAGAQDSTWDRCVNAAIDACDRTFPGDGLLVTAARGWCYTIATAGCALLGVKLD